MPAAPPAGEDFAPDLLGLLPVEAESALRDHFQRRGLPGYRVRQTLAWLHEKDAASFDEMTDLPLAERAALAARFRLARSSVARGAGAPRTAWAPSRTSCSWAWASRS